MEKWQIREMQRENKREKEIDAIHRKLAVNLPKENMRINGCYPRLIVPHREPVCDGEMV